MENWQKALIGLGLVGGGAVGGPLVMGPAIGAMAGGGDGAQTGFDIGAMLSMMGLGAAGSGGGGAAGSTNLFDMASAGGNPRAFDVVGMGGGAGGDDVPWRKLMTMGGLQGMGNMMGGQEQAPPQMVPGVSPPPPSPNPFASLIQPYQYYG